MLAVRLQTTQYHFEKQFQNKEPSQMTEFLTNYVNFTSGRGTFQFITWGGNKMKKVV